jgi:hypothetical protein
LLRLVCNSSPVFFILSLSYSNATICRVRFY